MVKAQGAGPDLHPGPLAKLTLTVNETYLPISTTENVLATGTSRG